MDDNFAREVMSQTITEKPYWKSLQNYIINPPSHTFQNEMKWTERRKKLFYCFNKFIFLKLLKWLGVKNPSEQKSLQCCCSGRACVTHFQNLSKILKLFSLLDKKTLQEKVYFNFLDFWNTEETFQFCEKNSFSKNVFLCEKICFFVKMNWIYKKIKLPMTVTRAT